MFKDVNGCQGRQSVVAKLAGFLTRVYRLSVLCSTENKTRRRLVTVTFRANSMLGIIVSVLSSVIFGV